MYFQYSFSMSSNEGYHNKIEPGGGSAGDEQSSSSGARGSHGSAASAAAANSTQLHQQILNENTYLKASKQAYFSDEKVLIPDDDRTNVSKNK